MTLEDRSPTVTQDHHLERLRAILKAAGVEIDSPDQADPEHRAASLTMLSSANPSNAELIGSVESADRDLSPTGCLVLCAPAQVSNEALAEWRNQIWPKFHATSVLRITPSGLQHQTLSGKSNFKVGAGEAETLLLAHRRSWVQSPEATVEKFDKNASGWNGEPGKPGYAHFRWMRRYLGHFARPKPGDRVLDFGCGAGWCGIESVAGVTNTTLNSFDPSPEMMRITQDNAAMSSVKDYDGRTGFGDAPPFPAEGEERYDLVISSGVVSFAPSVTGFLEGLVGTLKPGATLVFGDINAGSRGFRSRRRSRPLLPVREMNAQTAEAMRTWLEAKGFMHVRTAGYQLTWPIPEAMHFSQRKLKGLLSFPLLLANQVLAGINGALGNTFGNQFDSWAMQFTAPRFMGVTTGTPDSKYVYDEDGTQHLREKTN